MRKILLFFLPLLFAVSAYAQLSGTYTINATGEGDRNYTSFGAATSALSAGVSSEVIFQVAPGTYEEYVTVNAITGASSSNRVIFRGMGDDNQQVVITSSAGYTSNSTVTLSSADFVTFENMTLTTTSTGSNAVLLKLTGDVDNDRFENVRFVGVEVATSSGDNNKNLVHMDSGSDRNDNAFVGCQFINGSVALYLQGNNMTAFNTGVLVEDCYFSNQQFKSIYLSFYNDAVVRGNTIINANDYKTDYNAIDAFQCFNACVFENNVMNITRATSYATVVKLRPCVGNEDNHVIFRNNIVNLNSDANSYCFYISHANSAYIDVAHNTLKSSGTGENVNVFVEKTGTFFNFYNNLLINVSTSGYVFRVNNMTNRYSDYNRISYTCPNVARKASDDIATLQDWREATGLGANSALCTPQFVGDQDLHITSSEGLAVANPLAYVATDIDGEARSETPCAGADELVAGQNLPPVVANPIANVTFETFPANQDIDVSEVFDDPDDDNENIEITLVSNSNPNLVSAALQNDTITLVRLLSTGGTAVITLKAMSAGDSVETSFSVTCVAQDLPPVVVEPLDPVVFTAFPQTLSFDLEGVFDDPDNNNLFIEYEAEALGEAVNAYVNDEDMLVIVRRTANAFTDTVIVTATSHGKTVDMAVPVSGSEVTFEIGIADFEDVELSAQGYWIPEEEDDYTQMLSHGWMFNSFYSEYYWGGFTASNRTDTTQEGLDAQYTAITASGHNGSSNYAVAYAMGMPTTVTAADGLAHTVTGCYVTNNLWAYKSMRDGDSYSAPFGGSDGTIPDFFVLHAIGKDLNDNAIDTLDFYLADYRFDNPEEDYIVDSWEWFDLSSFGEVASISFTLESSANNSWGMVTPAYFCMDDFNGMAPVTPHVDMPPYIANPVADWVSNMFPDSVSIDLTGVVADDDSPADSIVYSLLTNSNETAVLAQVSENTLTITRLTETADTATLTLRATSGDLYVDFTVNVVLNPVTGVRDYEMTLTLFPNPTNGQVTLNIPQAAGFEYSVLNIMGQEVLRGHSCGESQQLNLTGYAKGVYLIKANVDGNLLVRKIVVR